MLVSEDAGVIERVAALQQADAQMKAADAEVANREADLMELIGAHEGLETPLGTITWRTSRRGIRLFRPDWRTSA